MKKFKDINGDILKISKSENTIKTEQSRIFFKCTWLKNETYGHSVAQ